MKPTAKSAKARDVINQLGRVCSRGLDAIKNTTRAFPETATMLGNQPRM